MIPVADMPKSPFKRKRYVGYKFLLLGMGNCTCLDLPKPRVKNTVVKLWVRKKTSTTKFRIMIH